MKCQYFGYVVGGLLFALGTSSVQASDVFFDAEATFFNYGRSPGSQVGDAAGDTVNFGLEAAPRFIVGAVNDQGSGARLRYWHFDHGESTLDGDGSINVDALTLDAELFHNIRLSNLTSVELSGGLRYTEFEELLNDDGDIAFNRVSGVGAGVGASVRRCVGPGDVVAGLRYTVMIDDKSILDDSDGPTVANDVVLSIAELGLGYEVSRCIGGCDVTSNIGVEWQKWDNFTEGHDVAANSSLDFRGGGGDVGFIGLVFGVGVNY